MVQDIATILRLWKEIYLKKRSSIIVYLEEKAETCLRETNPKEWLEYLHKSYFFFFLDCFIPFGVMMEPIRALFKHLRVQ